MVFVIGNFLLIVQLKKFIFIPLNVEAHDKNNNHIYLYVNVKTVIKLLYQLV